MCIRDSYMKAQPVYKIYGNGIATLEVNGNRVTAEVSGQLNIDTKLGICYNAANEISNEAISNASATISRIFFIFLIFLSIFSPYIVSKYSTGL